MPVYIVSTPIGNDQDLSQRAKEILANCDFVIGEDRKPSYRLLVKYGIRDKLIYCFNEHSTAADAIELADKCADMTVAMISDAGCPGFCDPGARMVHQLRKKGIEIKTVPGASCLTALLSLSSENLKQFVFLGFPPRDTEQRKTFYTQIRHEKRAIILMDTPYRLKKMLAELGAIFPARRALLGCDLTKDTELVLEGSMTDLVNKCPDKKLEFMVLIYTDGEKLNVEEKRSRGKSKNRN